MARFDEYEKPSEKERVAAVREAIDQIKDRFGEGAIMKLGEAKRMNVEAVTTGCISLDLALGVGGMPRGRVVEIYGPESSGKTTLAQHVIAEIQKSGGIAAFVDAEHALDPEYASRVGININDLLISQPDNAEQALEIVETLVRSNAVDVVVIDSVAALTPRAEVEGDIGDAHMGLQARLMSQALRKLTSVISKTKTIVIFLNQTRQKIGVYFGNPETTPGGLALKFYSSIRIEIRRAASIKQGEQILGNRTKVKIVKNKVAPPFRTTEFDIMYNEGISLAGDLLDTGVEYKVVTKSGNTYAFREIKLGVGREQAKAALTAQKELARDIREELLKSVRARDEMPIAVGGHTVRDEDASED